MLGLSWNDIFWGDGGWIFFIGLRGCHCCGRLCARPHGNVIFLSDAGEMGEVAVAGSVIWRSRAYTQLHGWPTQHIVSTS